MFLARLSHDAGGLVDDEKAGVGVNNLERNIWIQPDLRLHDAI